MRQQVLEDAACVAPCTMQQLHVGSVELTVPRNARRPFVARRDRTDAVHAEDAHRKKQLQRKVRIHLARWLLALRAKVANLDTTWTAMIEDA